MWRLKLKELLAEKGITQAELAETTGVATSTLSRFANNNVNRIDIGILNKISDALNLDDGTKLFELVIED